jgi:membrane protease YdiL (CAAX protease family)
MSEKFPPKPWTRLVLLALAILMPLLATSTLFFFAASAVMVGSSDRALVWAEGNRSQLDSMSLRVTQTPWFPQGRTRAPDASNPQPSGCSAAAREFSFGGLRAEQAQAARSVLEAHASDSGARICQSNVFIINEHPDPAATTTATRVASALLQSALIPCGLAVLIYWAFARQLRLQPNAGGQPVRVQVAIGALAGVSGVLGLAALAWLLRTMGVASPEPLPGTLAGLGPWLLLAVLFSEPLLEELAFRAWLIPLAERAVGTAGAAVLSTLLFTSVHLPFGWSGFAPALLVGGVLAATYVRTRSLLACVMANALMAAASLLVAG